MQLQRRRKGYLKLKHSKSCSLFCVKKWNQIREFRYRGNRIRLSKVVFCLLTEVIQFWSSLIIIHGSAPSGEYFFTNWCKLQVSVLLCCLSQASNFCAEIPRFSLPWQQGRYFTVTFIYTDPENRLLFVSIRIISLMQGKVAYSQFYTEIHKFSSPWQQGSVWATFGCHLKVGRPQNPLLDANTGLYDLFQLSYSQFCVEISQFSLPWQQRSVWAKFYVHHFIGWPR